MEENDLDAAWVWSVNRDDDAMGDAKDGIEAEGRIAIRPKLDVNAMRDRVDAMMDV